MERIIDKLLYENLISVEHIGYDNKKAKNARESMRENRSILIKALNENEKNLFYKYEDSEDEYWGLHEIALFAEGFRLVASILIDVLYGIDIE